jgi:primosomal protein N' (replication factor Y)
MERAPSGARSSSPRTVRVVVDEPALDKTFDYLVPDGLADQVRLGAPVRVPLHGRRVGGWIVGVDEAVPAGVALRPLARIGGFGPEPDLLDLAGWAAWRWAGRPVHFLRTASPATRVLGLPAAGAATPAEVPLGPTGSLVDDALSAGASVLRLPPAADRFEVVQAACGRGPTLVVAPSHAEAADLARRARRAGIPTALLPKEWARARAGTRLVIGARAAAWGPCPGLAAVVVLDEHEEVHQEEAAPTWHARDVARERAARAGAVCVLVSSCPSLEAIDAAPLVVPDRSAERAGWPVVDVVDRRREDPLRSDLYSSRLVDLVRSGRTVVCVLNRKGRTRLLACKACEELARCDRCGAAVASADDGRLSCPRCGAVRPAVCAACGSTALRQRRIGTSRAREDLERLAGVPVGEVTGDSGEVPDAPVLVGTEAVLRRLDRADAVAFLDLDAELLAPRYRAADETMALVVRAARLVGRRSEGGRLLLQTRLPRHDVVLAALHADPGRFAEAERERRRALAWPPFSALAHVSGVVAGDYVAGLRRQPGVTVLGPSDDTWLVKAADHRALCDALAATPRPPGRLRVAVDPPRV